MRGGRSGDTVGQPLHRTQIITPTRCHPMMTQLAGDWRVFTRIFADHWDPFQRAHPRAQTPYYDNLVAKMLACGNAAKMGDVAYRCLYGGPGKHVVARRCQSALCRRCAKVYVDNWVSQVRRVLHEGVMYRPSILTVPAMCRTTFSQHAAVLLRALRRCGGQCLDDCSSTVRGQARQGGSSTVLHPHGRNGPYHPHLHLLATRGGYAEAGECWEHGPYVPSRLLRRKWQWHLLSTWRKTLETDAMKRLVNVCCRQSPNGLVTNGHKGTGPSQYQRVARYVAKYVVSPPLAGTRIDRYDGERGTDHDRSHRPERGEHETGDVDTCIGRMVQHTMPQGCKRIRYDGVQATRTCAQVQVAMQTALAKVEGVVKGAVQIIARLTYRQRYEQSTGREPLICPHCRCEMGVWRSWHPTYGVIYDEVQVLNRGTYASTAPRAGP
jgi:hypothetical protein